MMDTEKQKTAEGLGGAPGSEEEIALTLLKDRYPHLTIGYRALASPKEILGDITKFYRHIYGSLAQYIVIIIGRLLMERAEKIKAIQNDNFNRNSSDPTHTQIAKDHTTHPLHTLAADLARHAVFELGTAMAKAWENKATLEEVIEVASKHWDHPQATTWMDAMVSEWAGKNPEKVKLAASRQHLEERAQALQAGFEKQVLAAFPQYAKAAGHIDEILKG